MDQQQQQVPGFTVISTQDSMVRDDQGRMVQAKRANVQFADGSQSYVEVAFGPGWSEQAIEAINQLWEEHQTVMSHQGPPVTVSRRRQNAVLGT